MDAYDLINMLNQVQGLADSLDGTGVVGVKALTNGQYTTRYTLKLELSKFLLYIANGNGALTDGEVSLINVVLGSEYNAYQLKQLENSTDDPNPTNCMTLMGFLSGDKVLNQQNGTRSTQTSDVLISLFETFGNIMVAFDENSVSKARCAKYISGMKSYVMKNL